MDDVTMPRIGDKVREIVSGFEGTVVGFATYLWGCEQALVSRAGEKGTPESEWWDVGRLQILNRDVLKAIRYEATPGVAAAGADKAPPIR